jgi:hypothetical protein
MNERVLILVIRFLGVGVNASLRKCFRYIGPVSRLVDLVQICTGWNSTVSTLFKRLSIAWLLKVDWNSMLYKHGADNLVFLQDRN